MSNMNTSIDKEDPLTIAAKAEQDLNSYEAKTGHTKPGHEGVGSSDSAAESGVNEAVTNQFPGAEVRYGSAASGAGDNRDIPDDEGGGINPATGRQTKAGDFEAMEGGPEDAMRAAEQERGGDQDVHGNVRQKKDPIGYTRT